MNIQFSLDLARLLYNSTEKFPVDFDDAWQWLGYSTKGNAKRHFDNCGFVQNVDYISAFINREECLTSKRSDQFGAFPEVIKMTCDALKMWGMMSGTENGKNIRMYFLECERVAKQHYKEFQLTKEAEAMVSIFREFEQDTPIGAKMASRSQLPNTRYLPFGK